jgi:secreted trypsin-like serine protease
LGLDEKGESMRRALALLAATSVLVFVPGSAGAITNGHKDTQNRYPFVGLLAFYDSDGAYMHRCTGTLLSPTVVLTAAHCTDGTATAYAYFSVNVPDDFRENPTGFLGTTYTHPAFKTNLHNDVGVVVLDDPVNRNEYPVLASVRFLTDLKVAHEIQDDSFVAVGYGVLNGFPPPRLVDNESRWVGRSPYRGLKKNNLHLFQNPVPDGAGGTCFGDSGGPHFWNDTLIIVSVTSWGDANCRANDQTQRVDIPSVLDWLEEEFGVSPA